MGWWRIVCLDYSRILETYSTLLLEGLLGQQLFISVVAWFSIAICIHLLFVDILKGGPIVTIARFGSIIFQGTCAGNPSM